MKNTIVAAFSFLLSFPADAQLANTRWKGTLRLENPLNVIFDCKKDTLSIYTIADSSIVETMNYSVKENILTIQKIEGQSDCDNTAIGKYQIAFRNDNLFLKLVTDPCDDRSTVLDTTKWFRWKDHSEVKVAESILVLYVGVYEMDPQHQVSITLENGRLQIEGRHQVNLPKSPMVSESPTRFFVKVAGVEMDFVKDAGGRIVKLISHEEKDFELRKIE